MHVALMVVLLFFKFSTRSNAGSTVLDAIQDIPAETSFDATNVDQIRIGAEVTALSATSSVSAAAAAASADPSAQQETADKVNEEFKRPEMKVSLAGDETLTMPSESILADAIDKNESGVVDDGTENVASEKVGEAIDRLA